jgi:hypothetical protein
MGRDLRMMGLLGQKHLREMSIDGLMCPSSSPPTFKEPFYSCTRVYIIKI